MPDRSPTNSVPSGANASPQATPRSVANDVARAVAIDAIARCRRTGSTRTAGRRDRTPATSGSTDRSTNGSRVPSGRTMKIDDRRLLAARAAEGDVEIAAAIEGRAVDLVQAGRERGADLDERRLARRSSTRTGVWPPSSPAGTMALSVGRRRERRAAPGVRRSRTSGRTRIDGEARRRDRDAPAFDGPERMDRGDARRTGSVMGRLRRCACMDDRRADDGACAPIAGVSSRRARCSSRSSRASCPGRS